MSKKISVTVEVVPTTGEPVNQTVEINPTGATVADVLAAAEISSAQRNIYVNGKPATLDSFVVHGQKVSAHTVRVEERPSGS